MDQLLASAARRRVLLVALGVVVLLVLGAKLVLHRGTSSALAPPIPTGTSAGRLVAAKRLVVDVVGAVRRPGLYRLTNGSRVADAVEAAGGETRRADPTLVNLAAPVVDGEQVVVPARVAGGGAVPGASSAGASGPLDLNSATLEQLDALPGIGPATAQKILDYRQQHGAFTSVDELDAVPGIGPAKLDQLKGLVAP